MKAKIAAFVVLVAGTAMSPSVCAETADEQAARKAAEKWLFRIDQQQFAKSWDEAAGYFKLNVKKDQWVQQVKGVRVPLGKVIERKLMSERYTTTAPGAPDGEYVIMKYNTEFEKKKEAGETITPMKDKDGTWRVSGYFIR